MGERGFVLYKLKEDVSKDEYAKWLREEHYPWGRSLPSQKCVEGYFVTGDYDQSDEVEWDNIAFIDIDDREAWYHDQQNDKDAAYHWEKWGSFVERYKIFFSEHIDA
jgi:hypothetical protein